MLYAVTPGYAVRDGSRNSGSISGRIETEIGDAITGGARVIQLREKGVAEEIFLAIALRAKSVTGSRGIPLIVNDSVQVAIAAGAQGVHIGQSDGDVAACRRAIGERMILGVSVQTAEEALLAESLGADYLGVGAMFPTGTKSDAKIVSMEELGRICGSVSIPVVAIGGITAYSALCLAGSGIAGIAVVSAIFGEPSSIRASAEKLFIAAQKVCAP